MKKLGLLGALALLLAFPAHAQIVGWIDCRHLRTDEKFGYIKVALMDGNLEVRSATRHFGAPPLVTGRNEIIFREIEGPAQVTGMRLACEIYSFPGSGIKTEETEYTVNWEKALAVPDGVKVKPALALTLVEVTPGLWRAFIGKAP